MTDHFRQFQAGSAGSAEPPRLLALATLALLALGAVACGGAEETTPQDAGPSTVIVETAAVEQKPLRDIATFSGQLDAEYSVVVKTEIDGVIEEILFDEGQRVEKGDVLIRISNGVQQAALREAMAIQALAQQEFDRTERLVTKNATSKAQNDRVAAELEIAKARADRARVEMERTRLTAPFSGVVGFRTISPGDYIDDESPVVRIDSTDRLQLTFQMAERGLQVARPGMPVIARVAAYPGEEFPGEVFVVSPTLDPATRRVVLKAWIPNADGRLLPGMFAETDLEVGLREAAITVPESAVVFDRHGAFVWRVGSDDLAERVPIRTGLRSGGSVEVTQGLEPGDSIVIAGTNKVSEGDRIAAAAPPPTGQARAPHKPLVAGGEGT